MQLQVEAVASPLLWSCLFTINIVLSGNYYNKDFLQTHGRTDPERAEVYTEIQFSSNYCFLSCVNAWTACSVRESWWRQVHRPPVGGRMCLRDRNRAASSSWSPAAMAVTRTSSSAELMASDKCVMGELSGPEVHGSSFLWKRDSVFECILYGWPEPWWLG